MAENEPKPDNSGHQVDIDQVVDKTVRKVYQESITAKYIECPGCGNLILRKYGECHKCRLRYNPVDQTWTDSVPGDEAGTDDDDDRVGMII